MNIKTYIVPKGVMTSLMKRIGDQTAYEGLKGMFSTKCSASGNLPATHYISSGILSEQEDTWLQENIPPAFVRKVGGDPFQHLADEGLQIIEEPIDET